MSESDFSRRTSQPSNKILGNELKILIRCIERFVRNRMHPYNVKDVRQYVYHNMGKHYQYHILHKIMKKEINLSFKK